MSLPVACTLAPRDGAARRRRWEALAAIGRPSARRLGHRLEVRYKDGPGVRNELDALAAAERDCCSFAKWRVSQGRGEVVLHVSTDPERADDISAIAVLFGAD